MKRKLKKEEGKADEPVGDQRLREAVRAELLQFAKDVASAEGHGKLMDVVTNVDEYVDRVVEEA